MMKNFTLNISANAARKTWNNGAYKFTEASLKLVLTNNEDRDFFINENDLLLGWNKCVEAQYKIISGPSEISCPVICKNIICNSDECRESLKTKFVQIKAGKSIENDMYMDCDFGNAAAGIYTVQFSTTIIPCAGASYESCDFSSSTHLSATAQFEIT